MEIYVVQEGDNIYSISGKFGISVDRLVMNNGLKNPYELTIGQALVIAYPLESYTVQEGDTLQSIADLYQVSLMKILRNNPYLTDREYIYPGETIVISYSTIKSIATNGFTYPYIRRDTLIKTLTNLTYLSVFNYMVADGGDIIAYHDDTEIVQTSIEYGVIPLLMLTSLTSSGEPNVERAYNLLLSDEYQENMIRQIIDIMKSRGYYGFNMVFNYLNTNSQLLYQNLVKKVSDRLRQEGFLFFITINYNNEKSDNQIMIEQVDYSAFNDYVNAMIFLKLFWGSNYESPSPISDINNIRALVSYVVTKVPVDKIVIGKPLVGYDWALPFIQNRSSAISISLDAVMSLAYVTDSNIQFDETSQTPFFYYDQHSVGAPQQHIVWFVDARSINALNNLINEYSLYGTGIWNIMLYNPQLWTILNCQFEIIKLV
jgi:spore germination protein